MGKDRQGCDSTSFRKDRELLPQGKLHHNLPQSQDRVNALGHLARTYRSVYV
jgi:hypothetical protein